ncbi:hypothetical protein AAG906_030035 [Vitis piasezkii]
MQAPEYREGFEQLRLRFIQYCNHQHPLGNGSIQFCNHQLPPTFAIGFPEQRRLLGGLMATPTVRLISECFIKPKFTSEETKEPCYLTPWDLAMLSVNYIQKGLLFSKPPAVDDPQNFMATLLDRLKDSLALTLDHFYPLAGRLATKKEDSPPSYVVFVDCNNSPGAKFIHAAADMTISDILSPIYVPQVIQSFFDHDRVINHDGHTLSLLSIQVTELVDGIFIGCSINHSMVDGTSFWHFFNAWSEVFTAQEKNSSISLSRPPILKRWFPDGYGPIINLPFTHHDEFISRFEAPVLRERIFHFSSESIAKLKAKANAQCNSNKISSFQALSALVWRSITRARCFPHEQVTSCRLATGNRTRLDPPLPENYFGNSIQTAVVGHTDKAVRGWLESWFQSHFIYQLGLFFDPNSVMMGSSPRFNKYGIEFGLGKGLAVRSGYAHKFDGKVSCYPGREGGGSIDLEVCLPPNSMSALESNQEFMEAKGRQKQPFLARFSSAWLLLAAGGNITPQDSKAMRIHSFELYLLVLICNSTMRYQSTNYLAVLQITSKNAEGESANNYMIVLTDEGLVKHFMEARFSSLILLLKNENIFSFISPYNLRKKPSIFLFNLVEKKLK